MLAALVADHATALVASAREGGGGVRVGVDTPVGPDGARLADDVTALLRTAGLAGLRASRDAFVRPRSVRLEHGEDPDAPWERWFDDPGLRRELLDPLGPGGTMQAACSLWDPVTDRATREPRRPTPPGAVVVVDGPFLLRRELADAFDLVVHLQTSAAAIARRGGPGPSWARYLDEVDPAARAGIVVRHDDPRHPALVHRD